MPVPSLISDLTTTPATNSPAGSESAKGVVDDYLRVLSAFIKQISDIVQGVTVTLPSAATVNIGFTGSLNVAITGTTTITGFDLYAEGAIRYVVFSGAMLLTHNAAVLVLPGAANITTVSGDVGIFKSNGSGKWTCLVFQRGTGALLTSAVTSALAGATFSPARVLLADGTAGAPSLSFASDASTDTGFFRSAEGVISVVCNGVVVGRFLSTGFEAIKVTQTA